MDLDKKSVTTRQRRYVKRRRIRRLCAYGGCRVRTGDRYMCSKHAAMHRDRMRRIRAARREQKEAA